VDSSVCEVFVCTDSDVWKFPVGRSISILGLGAAVVMCLVPLLRGSSVTSDPCISVNTISRPSMETNRSAGQSNTHRPIKPTRRPIEQTYQPIKHTPANRTDTTVNQTDTPANRTDTTANRTDTLQQRFIPKASKTTKSSSS
jgi:hypothetical protein